ncbi:MAG: HlyD family efflux transporter periplasmic adaptor subunit [Alphaproteobacteria bacterium]|nr:MAG: HlyD family efflux transporter periplasmic adaptor subunit [Alphaproteobacteria bacterium]
MHTVRNFDLRLSPTHIGMVKVGQKATIRLTAFEASHYGTLQGEVTRISADALAGADGAPTYQVWVKVPQTLVGARGAQPLKPGMVLVAAVVTGQHTVLDYILRPIRNALDDLAPHTS